MALSCSRSHPGIPDVIENWVHGQTVSEEALAQAILTHPLIVPHVVEAQAEAMRQYAAAIKANPSSAYQRATDVAKDIPDWIEHVLPGLEPPAKEN